jgi:enoyl-CoA hydratase/carnithine racemase
MSLSDGILKLELNINENNAMTVPGFAALDQALTTGASQSGVRAAILGASTEGFFCNGLSPNAVYEQSQQQVQELIQYFFSVLRKLLFFPVPVVAALNGHAMGYGAMLALMSDYRVMVDKGARICFPEINLGIGLPVFVARPLQHLIGMKAARDLLMFGKALKGAEALEIGLVDELVPADQLAAKSLALAKKLAGLSASAVRSMKTTLRQPYTGDLEAVLNQDMQNTLALLQSPDATEGFAALIEKRRPKFS